MSEQMLFDILLWLPVVSLMRFKTVCKSWFALIESSTFVTHHLHHHSGEDTLIVSHGFYCESRDLSFLDFWLFSGNKYEVRTNIDFEDRLYTTIKGDGGSVNFADSCDGIICLHNDSSGDVALWNPALKQLRPLPKSSISHQCCNIGFGFDAKANDYKVVRIIWDSSMPEVNKVEVYNLRTSFSWRIIHENGALPFTHIYGGSYHTTSKNGTCFWLGFDKYQDNIMLVSFDLKDEVFETMSLPDSEKSNTCYALDFLNDKLAYTRGLERYLFDNNCFEIWVLHEFGVKESWYRLYNIGPTPYIGEGLYPTGFSKNGEFLLLRSTFVSHIIDELYLYNLVTREESYPPIQKPILYSLHNFLHYNESLVSLKKDVNDGD